MHPRTSEVLDHLDTNRAALERALAGVPEALRERRPAPERWSVAEVIQHLALVEGRITQLLASLIDEARAAGLGPENETSPVTPTLDLAGLANRSSRITANEASQPRANLDADAAWAMLEQRRAELRALVHSADGLALEQVTALSPTRRELNAYQWILFVGGHEARHTAQIREIAAELDG